MMFFHGIAIDELELGPHPITVRLGDAVDGPEITFEQVDLQTLPQVRNPWAGPSSATGPHLDELDHPVSLTAEDVTVVVEAREEAAERDRAERAATASEQHRANLRAPAARLLASRADRFGSATRKPIIEDVSFAVEPGQVVAIVGPSGAGKSTLVKALIGQSRVEGTISYDGQPLDDFTVATLRSLMGYVPQEDILHLQLGLRDALEYCAQLRLPDLDPAERSAAVSRVLEQLDLKDRAGSRVATLSGGERKRASVAPELLTRPPVLFFDEPTTGLDPDAEKRLVQLIRALADLGRHTIVMITHSTAVLPQCDRVLVIAKDGSGIGRLACFGTPDQVLNYFDADDFADVYASIQPDRLDWLRFRMSPEYQENVARPIRRAVHPTGLRRGPSWAEPRRQLLTLARRNVAVMRGSGRYAKLLTLQAPLMAFLLYAVLGGGNLASGSGAEPRPLLAFLVIAALAMGLVNSCREIVKELPIYQRERTVGLSIPAYLGAKAVCLLVLSVVQSFLLAPVLAGQGGPSNGLLVSSRILESTLILLFAAFAAVAAGLLISALVTADAAALVLVPVLLVGQLLLTGAFLRVEGRPVLAQAAYATPAYWTFNGLAASNGLTESEAKCFRPETPTTLSCSKRWRRSTGTVVLSLGMLAAQSSLFLAGAYAALRRKDALGV